MDISCYYGEKSDSNEGIAILTAYHSVETKANLEPTPRKQFDETILRVLKAEIEVLMNESLAYKVTNPIIPEIVAPYTTPPFSLGEFVNQNTEFVIAEIASKLRLAKSLVKDALNEISDFVRDCDSHDSMDYTGQFHDNPARRYVPKTETVTETTKEPKQRGRKAKPRKDEKPIKHNGRSFKSIADAARSDPMTSYSTLRKAKYRQSLRQANENSI